MANNLTANTTSKVARVFLKSFEASRVISKTVNTSLLTPEFTPQFGDTVQFKRPHQYLSVRTSDGDISSSTKNGIYSGSAPAKVQNFITVPIAWTNKEEALQLDQLEEIIQPAAQQMAIDLETDFAAFAHQNASLHRGTVGTAISTWGAVAGTNSLMQSIGVPQAGNRYAVMNPFAVQNLAELQSGLKSGDSALVNTAWQEAQISKNFGGIRGLMSSALPSTTLGALAGATGTVSATPDSTYVTARLTMQQTITLTGLTASTTNAIRAGDTIKITQANRYRLHALTRQVVYDNSGPINWYYKVVTGGNTSAGGTVTITVTSAAINEANGQYNNISNPIVAGDTFQILGSANQVVQPNLFYHEDAFGVGFIKLPKLNTWDTVITTADGISIRVTKYADGDKNAQYIRFDMLPAYAVLNPNFAGSFYG